tara:strand:+ start:83 stop:331 length:249 start_codon:yes stop_codon:yes gene_type:complete
MHLQLRVLEEQGVLDLKVEVQEVIHQTVMLHLVRTYLHLVQVVMVLVMHLVVVAVRLAMLSMQQETVEDLLVLVVLENHLQM